MLLTNKSVTNIPCQCINVYIRRKKAYLYFIKYKNHINGNLTIFLIA